jgi:hypothetical protein
MAPTRAIIVTMRGEETRWRVISCAEEACHHGHLGVFVVVVVIVADLPATRAETMSFAEPGEDAFSLHSDGGSQVGCTRA